MAAVGKAGEGKVDQDGLAFADEDVVEVQVAVHDAELVNALDG